MKSLSGIFNNRALLVLCALSLLGLFAASPARAERMCYPYPDGGPGGYNKLTHLCNPLNMAYERKTFTKKNRHPKVLPTNRPAKYPVNQ